MKARILSFCELLCIFLAIGIPLAAAWALYGRWDRFDGAINLNPWYWFLPWLIPVAALIVCGALITMARTCDESCRNLRQ